MAEDQDKALSADADEPVSEAIAEEDVAGGLAVPADDIDSADVDSAEIDLADDDSVAGDSTDAEDSTGDDSVDDEAVREAERIAATVVSARPVRKKSDAASKGAPTPKQKRATKAEEQPRTGPITFVKQSVEELKKVNWPKVGTWKQFFVVVLVFVLIVIAYIMLLDLGFGWALLKIFGNA